MSAPRGRSGVRNGALLCLALGVVACAGASEAAAPKQISPEAAGAGSRDRAELVPPGCDLADEIAHASRLRGLAALGPIRCQVLARPQLIERAMAVALRDTPPQWITGQAQFLTLLELAPPGFDLLAAVRALIEEQLAGFYDPLQDELFVAQDLDPDVGRLTVVHEIVHALQDQHFDLGKRMSEAKTSDALSALQILAEGDATSAMLELPREAGKIPDALLRGVGDVGAFFAEATPTRVPVPAILKRGMMAPYTDGLMLVERLRAQQGWQAVNALWARAPTTSAELLHEASSRREEAPPVWAPPPAARGSLAPSYDDVTGEQSVRTLFEEWLPRAQAAVAAQGLHSDRLAVWVHEAEGALSWQLKFGSMPDIEEALHAFSRGLFKDQEQRPVASIARTAIVTRGCGSEGNPMALGTKGQRLVLVVQSRSGAHVPQGCAQVAEWAQAALR